MAQGIINGLSSGASSFAGLTLMDTSEYLTYSGANGILGNSLYGNNVTNNSTTNQIYATFSPKKALGVFAYYGVYQSGASGGTANVIVTYEDETNATLTYDSSLGYYPLTEDKKIVKVVMSVKNTVGLTTAPNFGFRVVIDKQPPVIYNGNFDANVEWTKASNTGSKTLDISVESGKVYIVAVTYSYDKYVTGNSCTISNCEVISQTDYWESAVDSGNWKTMATLFVVRANANTLTIANTSYSTGDASKVAFYHAIG